MSFNIDSVPTTWMAAAVVSLVSIFIIRLAVRFIPNNRIGIVEKRVSRQGSIKSGLIALRGEAGFQPEVLRGGWHVMTPFNIEFTSFLS